VVHQRDRPGRCVSLRPFTFDDAGIADPRLGGISPEAQPHAGRRLDIDHLAAPQGERQRDTACTPSDIDYDIVRFNIRSDNRQIWTKRSERIGLYERMVGGAADAGISRRLRAAQPRTLREHGVDPRSVPVGRTFIVARHHSIFRLISPSSTTKNRRFSGGTRKFQSDGTPVMISYKLSAQSKKNVYPASGKSLDSVHRKARVAFMAPHALC
jgi:hypothetical protein